MRRELQTHFTASCCLSVVEFYFADVFVFVHIFLYKCLPLQCISIRTYVKKKKKIQ